MWRHIWSRFIKDTAYYSMVNQYMNGPLQWEPVLQSLKQRKTKIWDFGEMKLSQFHNFPAG